MLHKLMEKFGFAEKMAVKLGTTSLTLQQARDPNGRLRPATVARLEAEIQRVAKEEG